jgi:hypothetical protein
MLLRKRMLITLEATKIYAKAVNELKKNTMIVFRERHSERSYQSLMSAEGNNYL